MEIADDLSRRLVAMFKKDESGGRPIYGAQVLFQSDEHFDDRVLFYEYFDGDTGRGLGANHQTGWTALVAKLIQPRTAD